jgi:hypothetical protein
MQRSSARIGVVVTWIAAEAYQVFFGAFTSLQLGAPGIGDRASWAPNLLVTEAFTILPIAFLLALWGAPVGRTIALAGAAVMLAVDLVAAVALGRWLSESVMFFLLVAPPALLLAWSANRMRRASVRGDGVTS